MDGKKEGKKGRGEVGGKGGRKEQPGHELEPIWDSSACKTKIKPLSHCTGPKYIFL